MGGQNQGIIFNQSEHELIYTLHHQELTSTEAVISRGAGIDIKADMIEGPNAGVNASYSE
jgi:hypothetical protein